MDSGMESIACGPRTILIRLIVEVYATVKAMTFAASTHRVLHGSPCSGSFGALPLMGPMSPGPVKAMNHGPVKKWHLAHATNTFSAVESFSLSMPR